VNVDGERTFDAPRAIVWKVLNDPSAMAATMPGVESFDVHDDRRWTANVKIPLGLGGLKMKVDMEKVDEREPEHAALRIKGQGVGAMMNMTTTFDLSDAGAGTLMKWAAEVKIAGPVGSMGQRVLQPIVNQQVSHVLSALDREVQNAIASGAAPSTTQGAGDTSTGGEGLAGHEVTPGDDVEVPPAEGPKDYGPPAPATTDPEPPSGTSGADDGTSPLEPDAYEGK
jgi:carbon monoxide dehydrogenase subunit G